MAWLPIAFVCEFVFGQLFKLAERRGACAPVLVSTNYLVLAVVISCYLAFTGQLQFPPAAVSAGLVTGTVFFTSMTTMTTALQLAPVSAVLTAFRLALVGPVVASVLLWNEPISDRQVGGILLAIFGLLLLTHGIKGTSRLSGVQAYVLIGAVFCCQSGSLTCLRWVHYANLDDHYLKVLCVTGWMAGTLGTAYIIIRRQWPRTVDLAGGVGIGLYNLMALSIILITLSHVPGTLFFPMMGCTVVVLDNIAARFLWKESFGGAALAGIGLALVAIWLVATAQTHEF